MAVGKYFLDTASFTNANTVYSDEALSAAAPDGFYSDGVISRGQAAGKLGPSEVCIGCTGPTPTPQPTVTLTPTVTPLPPTPTVTVTQPPTPTPAPSPLPTATPVPTPTATPQPTTLPSGLYYALSPCDKFADPIFGATARYFFALTTPVGNQRYVDPLSGNYYTALPSPLLSTFVVAPQNLIIDVSIVPNETGCPVINVTPLLAYRLRRCADGNFNFYTFSQAQFATGTRVIDTANDTYQVESIIGAQNLAGLTLITPVICVDVNGLRPSDVGFTGCATNNCGSGLYLLMRECGNVFGPSSFGNYIVSALNFQELALTGIPSWAPQTLYSTVTNKCYIVTGGHNESASNLGGVSQRIGGLVSVARMARDCTTCTSSFVV